MTVTPARPTLGFLALLGVCFTALAFTTARSRIADRARQLAETRLVDLAADAQDLVNLRAREETVALGQRPSQDTIAHITAALTRAGLPDQRLQDLSQQSDAALPGRTRASPTAPRPCVSPWSR